jgi:hypothetical protein
VASVNEPPRLRARPHWGKFPIPFVTYVDPKTKKPNFRAHDNSKRLLIARRNLCQLCGQSLVGEHVVFVGSSGSVERGTFGEPPMHTNCCDYAFQICPWLLGAGWRLNDRGDATCLVYIDPPSQDHSELGVWTATGYRTIPDDEGVGGVKWQPTDQVNLQWRNR